MILVFVVLAGAVGQLALAGFVQHLTRLQFAMLDQTWPQAKARHANTQNLWNTYSSPQVGPIDEHLAARADAGCIVDIRGCIGCLPVLAKGLPICEQYI